jgi:hypothetical protein
MKKCIMILSLSLLAAGAAKAGGAETADWKRNRISVSFKAVFNIDAEFIDSGTVFSESDPGAADGRGDVNRTYNNPEENYNKVDSTGNNHGGTIGTWYWGFSDMSQIPGNDTLVMTSTSATASGSTSSTDEPYLGFEMTYNRELGVKGRVHYGIEGAFGFFNVSITDTAPLPGTTTVITDTFGLNGYVPTAPVQNPDTFGPIIDSTVSQNNRQVTSTGGTGIAGSRSVDANIYGFRLGPYMDVDLGKDWFLTFSGGLAFAAVDSGYDLFESYSLPGGDVLRAGSDETTDWVVGGYVAGQVGYALSRRVSLFVGAQYQALGDVQQNIGGQEMILHLGGAVSGVAGVSVSF